MEFRVLGPVRATDADGEVPLGGPRQRRLLAVLLLGEGRVVSIDRIVEAVWGEEQPPAGAARTALSYVSRLRTALGDGYVSTRDEGYLLDRRDATVDGERFTALVRAAGQAPPGRALPQLDEALALWGGRAFGDLADEDWCRPAATRLEELRLVALEARVQARLLRAQAIDDFWRGANEALCRTFDRTHAATCRSAQRLGHALARQRAGRQPELNPPSRPNP